MTDLSQHPGSVSTRTAPAPDDGAKRMIRGIASTANRDRHGEIVDPRGIAWKLPLPLLASHDQRAAIGRITEIVASDSELRFVAEVSKATPMAQQVWDQIKDGTLTGVSIGFLGIEYEPQPKGLHWKKAELLEISVVAVPSNRESRILTTVGKSTEPATSTNKYKPGAGAVYLTNAR